MVRYFGGTKLGVQGLINAYKSATKDALKQAKLIEKTVDNLYQLRFGYDIMSSVMNLVKKINLNVTKQDFGDSGLLEITVRQSEVEQVLAQLAKLEGLKVEFLRTQ